MLANLLQEILGERKFLVELAFIYFCISFKQFQFYITVTSVFS
jgi:hypothetical protein